MKRMLISIALAATAAAQSDDAVADYTKRYFTNGSPNCRWYNELSQESRTAYMAGVWDAIGDTLSVTYGEATGGISSVCSVPENARITVFYAYLIFGQKVLGKDEKTISELTAEARRTAINGPDPVVPKPPKPSTKREKL